MKLFIVIREDLSPGEIACQACHALCAFTHAFPEQERIWQASSNNLALLGVRDERALLDLEARLSGLGFRCIHFEEPDLGGSVTALAIEPAAWRVLSHLPLALRRFRDPIRERPVELLSASRGC
jgi:peptidyl-tRNA hydrolase